MSFLAKVPLWFYAEPNPRYGDFTTETLSLLHLSLVKTDGLPEKAREIMNDLKFHFHGQYDEKDSIGKRYRRQEAIGTPYCITVDHQTLEDNCVTLRNRDTMQQEDVYKRQLTISVSLS